MPIKRIVHFLGKAPFLCAVLVETLIVIGRLLGVPKCLIVCTRRILNEMQAEYALGFITWFICLKSGIQVPSYNIYNLIDKDDLDDVVELLKPKIGNYRVNKQYQLLIGDGIPDGWEVVTTKTGHLSLRKTR